MPRLTAGGALARATFDAAQARWRRDGWRLRLVNGTGYQSQLQGQVREHDRVVLLYPDEADLPLAEVLFHEQVHILWDLNNYPPVEHLLVERFCRTAFPLLGDRRTTRLVRMIDGADRNGVPAADTPGDKQKRRRQAARKAEAG
jgi:hypothetical protein